MSTRFRRPAGGSTRVTPSLGSILLAAAAATLFAFAAGCGDDSSGPSGSTPILAAVSPDSGTAGTRVEITGSNFDSAVEVLFGDLAAAEVTVLSPTTLTVYAPDGLIAGTQYEVRTINPGGREAALPAAYRAVPPDLDAVNGVSRPSALAGSTIIFEGHAFGDRATKGTVWFTGASGQPVAASVTVAENWTNEFVITTVPAAAANGSVWIETPTGTSRPVPFSLAESALFSPSQIFWTQTTALPEQSQGHKAAFLSGEDTGTDPVIYLTGGADGSMNPRTGVWRAAIDPAGEVLPWAILGTLPDARAFHGSALATPANALLDTTMAGHLFVLGGITEAGTPSLAVYRAPVYLDRSLGAWVSESSLPVPLHSMGVAIFRSWLFVAGGATTGNAPVATVYRARIHADGSLGPWESQTALPDGTAYGALLQYADKLYLVGGDRGAVAPESAVISGTQTSSIYYSSLDLRTAELTSGYWTANASTLIKTVAKHTALVAGGTVLVSGGLYNGAGSSATEHQYAEINLDGSFSSFNGATGSQTIEGMGGEPFFNHAAITYVDASGVAHVLILGGNAVNNPASPLNETYYY